MAGRIAPVAAPASGVVHWVGAGLSTGSGLVEVAERADRLFVWHRTVERAAAVLARHAIADTAIPREYEPTGFAATVGAGDVVVSMLPADEHALLLGRCVAAGAHVVCSSYTTADLASLADDAAAAGLAVVTEAGLDPGIDHVLAHDLVDRAVAELRGPVTEVRFASWCGGLPATPNDFRYRFSWAPGAVLAALRSPARFVTGGTEEIVDRPWTALQSVAVGGEPFEAYPNRDSVPFVRRYGLPVDWPVREFVRGTLRLPGWAAAWADVFAVVDGGDDELIARTATRLGEQHPAGPDDRDRVVLSVELVVRSDHAPPWCASYRMNERGTAAESAMARCVSVPVAIAVDGVLRGAYPPGLSRPAEHGPTAADWLMELDRRGLRAVRTIGSTGTDRREGTDA